MFPSILNTFNRPTPTDRLNSPSHSALHNTVSSVLGQVQATIGVEGANSVVGTLMYNVRSPASDGGGHIQTAVRGGTGQNTFTKGDLLVATSASVISKLAVGTDNSFLKANSSVAAGVEWSSPAIAPVVRVFSQSKTVPAGTSRFDITNPSGSTFRYTYDGTGTDPNINATTFPVGYPVEIQGENFNAGNNGSFVIINSGANFFEVTNAAGVAENDKTIAGANSYMAVAQLWTRPSILGYVMVEMVGGGSAGAAGSSGSAGGYSRKFLTASVLQASQPVLPAGGGAVAGGGLQVAGFKSFFGASISAATGGTNGGGAGGTGIGGDINAIGQGGEIATTGVGGNSFFGGGGQDGAAGGAYGGGAGAAAVAGGNGVVIVYEY